MRTDESTLQMQPPARPVYPRTWKPRSTCSNCRACHPHACCAGPSAARKAAPRHACRRTTLLRVICANAAAAAAPPHAGSECTCLPVVPDKPRRYLLVAGPLTSESTALTLWPLPLQLSPTHWQSLTPIQLST